MVVFTKRNIREQPREQPREQAREQHREQHREKQEWKLSFSKKNAAGTSKLQKRNQRRTYSGVDVAIKRNKSLGAPGHSVDVLAIMRYLHCATVVKVGAVFQIDLVRQGLWNKK